ncbi:MAG TPA: 1,4-dihydroxy-2-naphthoate octaprenyltransferase [Deltaproteobacteria bacterium]|nr:1,4-dihydroxy-2-naphthoate octaprenyltransferase [Deltaproteobacteria bacterium]
MNVYRNWFLGSRPWSFTMTTISVSVGATLGAIDGEFSWGLFAITLLAAVMIHGATNLINDYYDVKNGVDTLGVSTAQYRPHPLVEGKLNPDQVKIAAYGLIILAVLMGLYLAMTRGWMILLIGIIGVTAGVTYTAPPFKYKYSALGEVSVFLMWGPLMVEGAYYVQRQALSLGAFWISIPFGILVALVIFANNIRDIATDRERGIKTLAIRLGQKNGLHFYLLLVTLSYLGILLMSFLGPLNFWSLIVFFSLPVAFGLFRQMRKQIPRDADAITAKLNTAFGTLLVLSLVLKNLW